MPLASESERTPLVFLGQIDELKVPGEGPQQILGVVHLKVGDQRLQLGGTLAAACPPHQRPHLFDQIVEGFALLFLEDLSQRAAQQVDVVTNAHFYSPIEVLFELEGEWSCWVMGRRT